MLKDFEVLLKGVQLLESDYDTLISMYRKTINCPIENKDLDQCRIRDLEMYLSYFGIFHEFDFENYR